jgi:hypothetical protein
VIDGESPCEDLKLLELLCPINCSVLSIGIFEEGGCLLNPCPLVEESVLPIDLFDLLWLEIVSGLKLCDFSQFLVDVANPLLERLEERFVLLLYDLYFIFGVLLNLWLRFF